MDDDDIPLAYAFDADHPADADLDRLLGGKGAGLVRMSHAGLPVPAGFTLTTQACRRFRAEGWSADFDQAIEWGIAGLEHSLGRRLARADDDHDADDAAPLLVSVRSGAHVSMPGMMDTVLDVGMNDLAQDRLARTSGDPVFALDTHRRALCSFAETVCGADAQTIDSVRRGADAGAMRRLLDDHGMRVPVDPFDQIRRAVRAVFASWDLPRARHYRAAEGIDDDAGTAVTIQAMVFGNLGDRSGTGVAFSRDPTTGERRVMGDFLVGAQGEDVVAGTHRTSPLADMATRWPAAWQELRAIAGRLELEHRDMVDIEFTVEAGHLWILQVRRGKRSPIAALRMAIDMAEDPSFPLDRAEAVQRCLPVLATPPRDAPASAMASVETPIATGLAASPGQASGVLCLDPDEAVRLEAAGVDVVLARRETAPADVHGMVAARALFTTRGGLVSHAAVVARAWGLPAVVGADDTIIDDVGVHGPGGSVEIGETVTVDGYSGHLYRGASAAVGAIAPEVDIIVGWRDRPTVPAASSGDGTDVTASAGHDLSSGRRRGGADEERFAVLHAIRIRGMVASAAIAAMTGLDERDVDGVLADLEAAALVEHLAARDLWRLTDDGASSHADRMAARRVEGDRADVDYERFLALNDGLKQLCTDWQLRDGVVNDHQDVAYDDRIVARLATLHDEATGVLAGIGPSGEVLPTMARYRRRLDEALRAVLAGDHRRLTGVMCDSYHDIWMELHEDLLTLHGIDRADEGST